MKLAEVHIGGFQCHRDLTVDLAPGFNALLGPTDTGKSAFVRAVAWVFYNEPAGMDFVPRGQKQASVKLVFDTGLSIERIRSKRVNRYVIDPPDGEPIVLDDFGRGLCAEVVAATGVRPIEIVGKDVWLNVQQQHDPPFLLTRPWSGIDRANLLDTIAENDRLAVIAADLNRDIQNLGRQVKEAEKAALSITEQIEELGDLDAEADAVASLETKLRRVEKKRAKASDLRKVADRIETADADARQQRVVLDKLPSVPAPALLDRLARQLRSVDDLRGCARTLERVSGDISAAQETIARCEATSPRIPASLAVAVERISRLRQVADEIETLDARIKKGRLHVLELNDERSGLDDDLEYLVRDEVTCPTCYGPLDADHLRDHL